MGTSQLLFKEKKKSNWGMVWFIFIMLVGSSNWWSVDWLDHKQNTHSRLLDVMFSNICLAHSRYRIIHNMAYVRCPVSHRRCPINVSAYVQYLLTILWAYSAKSAASRSKQRATSRAYSSKTEAVYIICTFHVSLFLGFQVESVVVAIGSWWGHPCCRCNRIYYTISITRTYH